jgi:hypothetical protein
MAASRRSGPYKGVGSANPNRSEFINGFTLTSLEKRDVIAFLRALTDSSFIRDPRFANPWSDTLPTLAQPSGARAGI